MIFFDIVLVDYGTDIVPTSTSASEVSRQRILHWLTCDDGVQQDAMEPGSYDVRVSVIFTTLKGVCAA